MTVRSRMINRVLLLDELTTIHDDQSFVVLANLLTSNVVCGCLKDDVRCQMADAGCSIGSSLLAQSTILVDSLYLPGVVSGVAIEGSLLGEAGHLAIFGDDIADSVWDCLS